MNIISASKGLTNFNNHMDLVIEMIINKTKKLNKNYTLYKQNYLYIFAHVMFNKNDIEYIIKHTKTEIETYKENFDTYFINCMNELIIISYLNYNIKTIQIDVNLLHKIKDKARNINKNVTLE
jgi:hypothetical protein